MPRHFISISDLSESELRRILSRARALKREWKSGASPESLRGRVLTMIFEKASTRTRVSFEAGMAQLGGHAIMLGAADSQLSRGETIDDTARVVSRMSDAVMIRAVSHKTVARFADAAESPTINGLSDCGHPCQILADIMTAEELLGDICGKIICWVGDFNNVCRTWLEAAGIFQFELRIASPPNFAPPSALINAAGKFVRVFQNPFAAAENADIVTTDVWVSMGDESDCESRLAAFAGFSVNSELMARAKKSAIFLHCLPARRGEEVSADVMDGKQSEVWREAENRLHAQKALLEFLILGEKFDGKKNRGEQ